MATARAAQPTQQQTEEEPTGLPVEPLDRANDDETKPAAAQPTTTPATGNRAYTEEELRAAQQTARQQEHDKLYGKISEQDETLRLLKEDLDARKAREAEAQRLADEQTKAKEREELSAKELLEQQGQQWEQKFQELQREREADRALLAREAQFQQLAQTRDRILDSPVEGDPQGRTMRDTIAPQLLDYVGGDTEQAIMQSIAMAQRKTADIVGEVQSAQQRQRQGMKGASVTQPPVGPMETDQVYETLTPDDIQNMSMADYAKNRAKLLAAASRAAQGAR